MLIVMKADATEREIAEVERVITELGYRPHTMPGASRTAIGITGNEGPVDVTRFETLPGVAEAIRVTKPYKLISLDLRPEKTVVKVGDAFKPRTSPYAFQGLGEEGLKLLAEVREAFGLKIVTEAVDEASADLVEKYADVFQVGARNMQNFSLLKRAGRSRLPVLLKRGLSAMLEEWLLAAEYIMSEGNYNVIPCERGVCTFAQHTRN